MPNSKNEIHFRFTTDVASFAIFDSFAVSNRSIDDIGWWTESFETLPEVKNGILTLIALGSDGIYNVSITGTDLQQPEKDFVTGVIHSGLKVVSGRIQFGCPTYLPGGGVSYQKGCFEYVLPTGNYELSTYKITPLPGVPLDTQYPDFVIVIKRSEQEKHYTYENEPRLADNNQDDDYLYASEYRNQLKVQREVPKIGIKIKVQVLTISSPIPLQMIIASEKNWLEKFDDYYISLPELETFNLKKGDIIVVEVMSILPGKKVNVRFVEKVKIESAKKDGLLGRIKKLIFEQ